MFSYLCDSEFSKLSEINIYYFYKGKKKQCNLIIDKIVPRLPAGFGQACLLVRLQGQTYRLCDLRKVTP